MYARLRGNYGNIDICIVAVFGKQDVFLQRIMKIVPHKVALIRTVSHVAVDQHNWIVVAPMSFWRMPKFTMHYFKFLKFVAFESHFMYEISHENKHDKSSILLKYFSSRRSAFSKV